MKETLNLDQTRFFAKHLLCAGRVIKLIIMTINIDFDGYFGIIIAIFVN